ncbi:MAG: hypothetical protein IKT78_05670, partial [Ruminiclostridium sp.]|nr:hypothetical protein [Ruminiclostridium sp.]
MKLGQALVLAASAAAAVGAAVYAKKKIENSEQADGLAAKGFQWKDLPEELNVIRKVKKNNPDKIIITTDGIRDADEPFYDKQEEDEVVTRLAEDIREVMSEDIFEAEETADDISEELVEKTTVADLVSNTEKDRSAPQKKAKQKKYYAPVDFTFTEEAGEAPVAFENAMDHIKKIELSEEEKAELEAHEDYSDVVAEDNKIFDEFLNAPIPKKEETEIFTAEEIEENVGLRDENEEKAFKDFVEALAAEVHPASAPLVVNEVTAIPDSEAERIKTDTVLIPTIEKISDDDNEEEITEEEQPSPEAEELPAVEVIEEIPTATETAEFPAVEVIEEIPVATEIAGLP